MPVRAWKEAIPFRNDDTEMKPLTAATLKGTWSTLLLPLNDSDKIQWSGIDSQLNALFRAEVDGIYINGTAGEFYSQSNEEFLRLARITAAFCEDKQMPFQIGASHTHAVDSLRRIEQTRELNPGAFQVILPEWTPLTWEEIIYFLKRMIAAAAPVPLVIYNPPNAQKVLTPQEWEQLVSTLDGIIGIKVLGGDTNWHMEMKPVLTQLSVFVAGIRLASGVIHGYADGSYSNLACLSPLGAVRWGRRISSDPEDALIQEAKILKTFETALRPFRGKFSNSALDKALASAGDWADLSPRVRWPLSSISVEEVQRISTLFREELPFLFEEKSVIE
ncbi:MAG: dihydrodipicolinate synthase family protein [Opitutales bacterium]|nr:dihydrodipicolinate synthase family protein [Opitutales bacterium]